MVVGKHKKCLGVLYFWIIKNSKKVRVSCNICDGERITMRKDKLNGSL